MHEINNKIEEDFRTLKSRGAMGVMETCIRQIYVSWILKPGCVAIDIGAHKGLHTIPMADAVGESGRVIAFEANSALCLSLTKKCLDRRQVLVVNTAVSDGLTNEVQFFLNPSHLGQSTIVENYGNNFTSDYVQKVPAISIDGFLFDYLAEKRFAFVKIDAEGAELPILQGMAHILASKSPLICAEISIGFYLMNRSKIEGCLHPLGYAVFTLSGIELTSLTDSQITDLHSVSYTLVFCKRSHWTYDFASNPNKMASLVHRVCDFTLSKQK